ncbi:MAG: PLP-dependent aminotransferase family protein [Gammaproteobacteria bacterium]|nr:PLP-dependent aminotransferase family protein [Gammaproteobacteria bacterium]MYE80354.1 PLP-dependent aminotransferase family protein [Gammaproteobacteria bacterium]
MPERIIDFAVGRTNPETFPIERMQRAATEAIAREFVELTDYPGKLGHPGLRAAMARRESEREGVPMDPDRIALTNGSMQGVTLVAEALTRPGDTVVCEEFTYVGTIGAYRSLGIDMQGVPVDEDGMRVDLLEAKLDELGESRRPKFIYALTTYQNPTGATMPVERRRRLVEIAERRGIPIVEDNCYGDVHFDGEKPPALFALSGYAGIVYLCSLSKILAPGLRLGYVFAQSPLLDTILARRHDAGSNTFAAAVVAELYRDGVWDLTEELNAYLKVKKNLVVDGLDNELSDLCAWSNPAGGLFVWVRFPDDVDQDRLARLAAERGVHYAPGANFHIHGTRIPYLRLAFGHVPDADIRDGIPILARCIREARTSNAAPEFDSLFDRSASGDA